MKCMNYTYFRLNLKRGFGACSNKVLVLLSVWAGAKYSIKCVTKKMHEVLKNLEQKALSKRPGLMTM